MPPRPGEPLSSAEKALLRRWIEQGAKNLPRCGCRQPGLHRGPITGHSGRRQDPCDSGGAQLEASVRTAIDRFIQRALEDQGLTLGPAGRSHDRDPPLEL